MIQSTRMLTRDEVGALTALAELFSGRSIAKYFVIQSGLKNAPGFFNLP